MSSLPAAAPGARDTQHICSPFPLPPLLRPRRTRAKNGFSSLKIVLDRGVRAVLANVNVVTLSLDCKCKCGGTLFLLLHGKIPGSVLGERILTNSSLSS
jgi:hypothetical protein